MNRQDLVDVITENAEASRAATTCFLDSLITTMQNEVAKGDAARFTGFDTFKKAVVAARIGHNPKTDAPVKIPSTRKPKFTPGVTSKDLVKD